MFCWSISPNWSKRGSFKLCKCIVVWCWCDLAAAFVGVGLVQLGGVVCMRQFDLIYCFSVDMYFALLIFLLF